jgi:transposase
MECDSSNDSEATVSGNGGTTLSLSRKIAIVDQLIAGTIETAYVVKKYNVKYRTVRLWVSKRNRKKLLKLGDGRPRSLDDISLRCIAEFLDANGPVSEEDLRDEIRSEHHETYSRRVASGIECRKYRAMSRNTVLRYVSRFSHALEQPPDS